MMPAIEITDLSKSFPVGRNYNYFPSIRDSLANMFNREKGQSDKFWALQGLNLNAMPGETIGIIGKNGAGKTTLMKVLSRITPPTSGRVTVRGRLACLLEVGTGFHPELTGRENIFLNGSILGLKRREVLQFFDEIVDFSGVGQFIDKPLKHFSTGMQLRLAFAVAAHLNPEILLIDEVLAVGDAEFQKKCLQKMEAVSKSGKTILFVSHNLQAVRELCQRGIVLDRGRLLFDGPADNAVNFYEGQMTGALGASWVNDLDPNDGKVFLQKIELVNERGEPSATFLNSEAVRVHFFLKANETVREFSIGFDLVKNGMIVLRTRQLDTSGIDQLQAGEAVRFTCELPKWLLNEGLYSLRPDVAVFFKERLSRAFYDLELPFQVFHDPSRSQYHLQLNGQNQPGVIFPSLIWSANDLKNSEL